MLADIRIAGESSEFGFPAAKLGLAYGYDDLKHLVLLVGPSWAKLLMYTGMRIDSAEALRIGIVDRVVPDAELWNATTEIAAPSQAMHRWQSRPPKSPSHRC